MDLTASHAQPSGTMIFDPNAPFPPWFEKDGFERQCQVVRQTSGHPGTFTSPLKSRISLDFLQSVGDAVQHEIWHVPKLDAQHSIHCQSEAGNEGAKRCEGPTGEGTPNRFCLSDNQDRPSSSPLDRGRGEHDDWPIRDL